MAVRFMGFAIRVRDDAAARIAVNYVYRGGQNERVYYDVVDGYAYENDDAERDDVDYVLVSCCTGNDESQLAGICDYYAQSGPRKLDATIAAGCAWAADCHADPDIGTPTHTPYPCQVPELQSSPPNLSADEVRFMGFTIVVTDPSVLMVKVVYTDHRNAIVPHWYAIAAGVASELGTPPGMGSVRRLDVHACIGGGLSTGVLGFCTYPGPGGFMEGQIDPSGAGPVLTIHDCYAATGPSVSTRHQGPCP